VVFCRLDNRIVLRSVSYPKSKVSQCVLSVHRAWDGNHRVGETSVAGEETAWRETIEGEVYFTETAVDDTSGQSELFMWFFCMLLHCVHGNVTTVCPDKKSTWK